MLDRVIVKDWGLMLPVRNYELNGRRSKDEEFCAIAFIGEDGKESTSIHRHSCESRVIVVRGQLWLNTPKSTMAVGPGDSVSIPANVWHRLWFSEANTLAVEWYDHAGTDYPIERHEGEDWPDE